MAGIIGSTSPCVQVVDTHLGYFYSLPPIPALGDIPSGVDPDFPFTSRNVIVIRLLITCPGIWTIHNTAFTYTNMHGETFSMSIIDVNNSFPVVLPENETIEVHVAWDFFNDFMIIPAGATGTTQDDLSPYSPNFIQSMINIVQSNAFNFCVNLLPVPYLPPPPPPPPPGSSYPEPNSNVPSNHDGGISTDLPAETDPTGDNNGAPHIPGGNADTPQGAENPTPYDPTGGTSPQHTVPNMASPSMYKLRKFDVKGRILGDFNLRSQSPGSRPPMFKADKPTTTMPVAGIGEPQEVHFTQLYNKSALKQSSFGPGQSFVPRIKNSNVVQNLVYKPNRNQIVGKKTTIKTTLVSDKSVGNRVNIKSVVSNPNIDIDIKEPHGSNYSVDNFNSYVTKDPKAGSRLESMPIYNLRQENKVDSKGNSIKPSQLRKDGAASSSPKAAFNLFFTNIPKNKVENIIFRKSTRQLAETSGNQDYEVPLSNSDFTIVDDSNIIYNGGQGLFYGVGPFETVESDEFLQGLFTVVPAKDKINTFVTVNDSSIVESNVVTPASIGIQNDSFHQTEHNCLIILGILDSETTFRYIGYNYINILPRSYQFMNAIIPPGLPSGAAKVVGMVFNSNNELILSEIENIIIAPDGYTVEGYTPFSPYLPASLADLANSPVPLHGGRVFEVIGKRRYKAISDSVDVIVKAPQIAITRGLDCNITAMDSAGTGVSSDRYTIDGVEIFAGAHDAYLQFDTTSGNNVDIRISDAANKTHSTYGFNVFGSNLEFPSLVFSGIANSEGYLGGHIQTNVINGRVLLENERTSISTTISTTHNGYLILETASGWTQAGDEITQVVADQVPYLGFNSLPGDTIYVYAEGIGGNYNDLIVENTLQSDLNSELPTAAYTLPEDANIPVPIPDPSTNGNTIPQPNPPVDPSNLPGTDPDDDLPPPPLPPGNPFPSNGECQETSDTAPIWKVNVVSVCQRASNPCIVDIVANLHECDDLGNPIPTATYSAQINYDKCSFSLDSTNGIDGSWYQLMPLQSDAQHSGEGVFSLPGTYNFVADMCDHFSTFFSTSQIIFKLVFNAGTQQGSSLGICDIDGGP